MFFINDLGQFDFMSAAFQCLNCKFYHEATAIDYFKPEFLPGSLGVASYLFDRSLLRLL